MICSKKCVAFSESLAHHSVTVDEGQTRLNIPSGFASAQPGFRTRQAQLPSPKLWKVEDTTAVEDVHWLLKDKPAARLTAKISNEDQEQETLILNHGARCAAKGCNQSDGNGNLYLVGDTWRCF